MASETLTIPEEDLIDVIQVIRAGLNEVDVQGNVEYSLNRWCNEMEEYMERKHE